MIAANTNFEAGVWRDNPPVCLYGYTPQPDKRAGPLLFKDPSVVSTKKADANPRHTRTSSWAPGRTTE